MPTADVVSERSRLTNSRVYSPAAISVQDLLCSYTDAAPKAPSGNQHERHSPLNITVRQITLGFTLRAAEAFVVTRFVIVNNGPPLRKAWLAMYAQLASGKYKVLEDPKGVFGFQNVYFVINKDKLDALGGDDFMGVINSVNKLLTAEAMTSMNAAVDLDKKKPADVAKAFLEANNLGGN